MGLHTAKGNLRRFPHIGRHQVILCAHWLGCLQRNKDSGEQDTPHTRLCCQQIAVAADSTEGLWADAANKPPLAEGCNK